MARRDDDTPITLALAAIGVSVAAHLLIWPITNLLDLRVGGPPVPETQGILEVSLVDDRAEKKTQPDEKDPDKQVVDLDYLEHEERPKDAKYFSEFNSNPDREFRAPKNRRGQPKTGDRPDVDEHEQQRPSSPSRNENSAMRLPLGGREAVVGKDDSSTPSEDDERGDERPNDEVTRPPSLSPRGAKGLPDRLRKDWGSPGTHDSLDDDMEVGPGNMLKTDKWKYASFFNRVKNGIAQHWHPEVVHAANDPDGRIHGTKTRKTVLLISLNADGSLSKVRLDASSRVGYLDEEAIRAVRQAAPFTNPPPGLVDESSGKIEFLFGFIFEIDGTSRIFRYRR